MTTLYFHFEIYWPLLRIKAISHTSLLPFLNVVNQLHCNNFISILNKKSWLLFVNILLIQWWLAWMEVFFSLWWKIFSFVTRKIESLVDFLFKNKRVFRVISTTQEKKSKFQSWYIIDWKKWWRFQLTLKASSITFLNGLFGTKACSNPGTSSPILLLWMVQSRVLTCFGFTI